MGACYWGFGTRGNRIAWVLVVILVLIGTAFWIPGVVEVKKCINAHQRCVCQATSNGGWVCLDPRLPAEKERITRCYESYVGCMRTPAAVWGVGWFFLVLLSWIPCCYFCCCSQNPKDVGAGNGAYIPQGVQMAPMTGSPAGQPYSPYGNITGYPHAPSPTTAYPAGPAAAAYPAAAAQGSPGQQAGGYSAYTQMPYDSNVPVHRY